MEGLIFKIVHADEWAKAEQSGLFVGSNVDRRDGFIHFSTAAQVHDTAARHFAGHEGLLLVAVATDGLAIQWEPSRGGAGFPHLYAALPLTAVQWTAPLAIGADGRHEFPELLASIRGRHAAV